VRCHSSDVQRGITSEEDPTDAEGEAATAPTDPSKAEAGEEAGAAT
jgi:hypothetical protein